jgi:hypothetical protein
MKRYPFARLGLGLCFSLFLLEPGSQARADDFDSCFEGTSAMPQFTFSPCLITSDSYNRRARHHRFRKVLDDGLAFIAGAAPMSGEWEKMLEGYRRENISAVGQADTDLVLRMSAVIQSLLEADAGSVAEKEVEK